MKAIYLKMSDVTKGYFCMMGFCVFAAISYLSADFAFRISQKLSSETAIFWGFLCANGVSFLGIFSSGFRQEIKKELCSHGKLIVGISFLTTIGAVFWYWALKESNAGILSFLSKSEVLFVAFFGIMFLNEKFSIREIPGILIALLGIICLANLRGEISFLAVFFVLFAKIFYAIQSVLVKKFGTKINAKSFTILRSFFMLIFVSLIFIPAGKIEPVSGYILFLLALSQMSGLVLARVFYFEAHKFLPVSKLNFFTFLTPILTALGSFLFFKDSVSSQKWVGMTLVLTGLFLFMREQLKLQKNEKSLS